MSVACSNRTDLSNLTNGGPAFSGCCPNSDDADVPAPQVLIYTALFPDTDLASNSISHSTDTSRSWVLVAVATACGYAAAYNIGKLPPSIPALRGEFATSLTWVAALVSSFSLITMTCSLLMGGIVARLGIWRMVIAGLLLLVLGGAAGARTHEFEILLIARVLEGFGYLAIAITMPAFIARVCSTNNRSLALGIWSTFVPGGITLCMVSAPWLASSGGWRMLWWAGTFCASVLLVLAFFFIRPAAKHIRQVDGQSSPPIRSVFTKTTIVLTLCFALYSLTFTGLATFLPTFWTETTGISLSRATQWAAVAVAFNILGNLLGGWLYRYGLPLRRLLFGSLVITSVFGAVTYLQNFSFEAQLCAACLFTLLGGITPATLFTKAAEISETPGQNGLLVGLLFQGAGFGQVTGPLLVGAMVDSTGNWSRVPLCFLVSGVLATLVVLLIPSRPVPS